MAPKKTARSKSRKTVVRAKATRKSSIRSERKAPRGGDNVKGPDPKLWPGE